MTPERQQQQKLRELNERLNLILAFIAMLPLFTVGTLARD
jgi:hypothetical protein